LAFTLSSALCAEAQLGIVDCIGQGEIRTSHAQGVVVDPTGIPVPSVVVSLYAAGTGKLKSTTGPNGKFSIEAPEGQYRFKVEASPFAGPDTELRLGRDLISVLHPNELHVVLGLAGSFCPWVATSDRAFKREINSNKQRLQEKVQKNATQK
jgi:hypothetical protein